MLIGAIGDAATDFVNYFFVWLGRHSGDLKRLGRIAVTRKHEAKELVDLAKRETSEHDGHAFRDIARVEQGGRIMPAEIDEETLDEGFDKDVADDAYRPYVVLQTAQRVLSHLEEDKPRKYVGVYFLACFFFLSFCVLQNTILYLDHFLTCMPDTPTRNGLGS